MGNPNGDVGTDKSAKIVVALCVLLLAAAMFLSFRNQRLFDEIARLQQENLDRAGIIGWVRIDPETVQLYFVRR